MSYTATIERKRRSRMYRGSDSFETENRFRGRAVRGTASIKEYGFSNDIELGVSVHVDEEAGLNAVAVEGSKRDFVTVEVATYHADGETLRNPEATLFMSEGQARALRDSLIALDI